MNDLQHIRSMAEMIIQKVDSLEGQKTEPQCGLITPKFKVGDRVSNHGTGDRSCAGWLRVAQCGCLHPLSFQRRRLQRLASTFSRRDL